MNKKNCLIVIAVAVVSFVLGFMVKFIISEPNVKDVQENEVVIIENESIEVMVRVREGYVEWHDGTTWNRAQSVAELQTEDIYNLAQDDLKSFEESYRVTLDVENEALMQAQNEIMNEPLVGSDKKPVTTTTSVATGADNTAETVVANVPGQSAGVASSGSAGSTSTPTTSTNPGTTTPSGTETTTPPADSGATTPPADSGATTPPSTPSTGDGEDIGWSDDYL